MSSLIPPHFSPTLKPLLVNEAQRAEKLRAATSLKQIPLTTREISDLLLLGMGAYTPLSGFMGRDDWHSVCTTMHLANGVFWPIPITLSTSEEVAQSLGANETVALIDPATHLPIALMQVAEHYRIDRTLEAKTVFGTDDPAHPGVQKLLAQGAVNLAGSVEVLDESTYPTDYPELYLRPAETRSLFAAKGWHQVAAFQTRNPMHRSHEHLVRTALDLVDGVMVHQVLGKLKADDIPAPVRTAAIAAMMKHYFKPDTVLQAGYPIEMRYAGPREALLHAVIRQNFGCTHLIVGRDHAGVGSYYGPFDAQMIFDQLAPSDLLIKPMKFDVASFCKACDGMVTARSCPHEAAQHVSISGTALRRMLEENQPIPEEFARPEVVAILRDYYRTLRKAA